MSDAIRCAMLVANSVIVLAWFEICKDVVVWFVDDGSGTPLSRVGGDMGFGTR